jgi:predicted dehydrogenase
VATRSGEAIDVEDVAVLAVEFESGAIGSLHAGYVLSMSGSGYHNRQGYNNYLGVYGRLGRLYWNRPESSDTLFVESSHPSWNSAPQREVTMPAAESPAYGGIAGEEFIRRFIRAAQGDGEAPTSGRDALQVARIVDAAYESSRTGRRIAIEQG